MHLLRGLLVLTLFCNVLSAEVHELAGFMPGDAEAGSGDQPSAEEQAHGELEDHAMSVYKALDAGYHAELSKEVIGELRQTFPNFDHDELGHLGDLTKEERDAFHYIKGLKTDYEKLTGKKIEAGDFTPGEEGPDADTTLLLHDLKSLSAEMYGGAAKVPKTKDVMIVNSHEDFIKELEKLQEENKYAFGGIPPPTHPGGAPIETAPVDTENANLPTMEENARQMAVKDATKRDSAKTDKYESAKYEAEEAQKLNTEAAEMDMPESEVSLLQIAAEPEVKEENKMGVQDDKKGVQKQKSKGKDKKTEKGEAKKTKKGKVEKQDAPKKEKTAEKQDAPKQEKTAEKQDAPKQEKTAKPERVFDKTIARLDELKAVVVKHKNALGDHLAKATDAANEAERRENAAALAAQAAEDKAVKDSYEGTAEEIVCEDPTDMACLRKRLAALTLKTRKAKHTAYDLGRHSTEVAMLDSSTKFQKDLADNAAEQESVYAAFVSSQEDRVRQQIVRLAQANTKKELAQKTAIKKALEAKRLASGQITDPTRIPISFDKMGQPHAHVAPAKAKKVAKEQDVVPGDPKLKPASAEKKPEEPEKEAETEAGAEAADESKKEEAPTGQDDAGVVSVKPEAVKANQAEDVKAEVVKSAPQAA